MDKHRRVIVLSMSAQVVPEGESLMVESFGLEAAEQDAPTVPMVLGMPVSSQWTWDHIIKPVLQAFTS